MRNVRAGALGALFMVLAAGCGQAPPPPIVPVEGLVRLDGRPLNKATVRFVPQIDRSSEYIAVGVTDEAGHFQLICKGQPGACACVNQVLVGETEFPPKYRSQKGHAELAHYFQSLGGRPLPQQYSSLIDSPLSADVKAGQTEYDFDLTH